MIGFECACKNSSPQELFTLVLSMLETERLILRPAILADAPLLLDLNSDPDVVRYTGEGSLANIFEAEKLVKDRLIPQFAQNKMGRFSTFLKDGTYIGWCGLKYFPETNEVDLGYRFKKKFWAKGYGSEAAFITLKYGFETLGLKRIIAKAMPDNIGSIKVMQKMKMTFRGYVNDPTDPHSFVLYDMTQEEFKKCVV
jgi:ribosomal-protein-alanine N-acetyltransferase